MDDSLVSLARCVRLRPKGKALGRGDSHAAVVAEVFDWRGFPRTVHTETGFRIRLRIGLGFIAKKNPGLWRGRGSSAKRKDAGLTCGWHGPVAKSESRTATTRDVSSDRPRA
jgi:hypothetical protein